MTAAPVTAYIGLGANLGKRMEGLRRGVACLSEADAIHLDPSHDVAGVYETSPVGVAHDQPDYLNTCVRVTTTLPPHKLLTVLQAIELRLGRDRTRPGASRPIDLDLLLYGDQSLNEADLVVPHPRMHERRFVLEPLCELDAGIVHPTVGVTIEELAIRSRSLYPDQAVRRMEGRRWLERCSAAHG